MRFIVLVAYCIPTLLQDKTRNHQGEARRVILLILVPDQIKGYPSSRFAEVDGYIS